MLIQSGGGKSDPAEIDPEILAKIAADAGMKAGEAIQQELGSMSEKMMAKMDEIKGAVNAIASKLDGMDKKLDASMELQQKSLNITEVLAAKQQGETLFTISHRAKQLSRHERTRTRTRSRTRTCTRRHSGEHAEARTNTLTTESSYITYFDQHNISRPWRRRIRCRIRSKQWQPNKPRDWTNR